MARLDARLALPERDRVRQQFDRAARSFAAASFMHDEARRRLLERLDNLSVEPRRIVDLGAGFGAGAEALQQRYPQAQVIAVDSSRQMLRRSNVDSVTGLVGDAEQLPFPDGSVDLMFSNLVLPWARPETVFAEARRVLHRDGVLVFSTLGPDTLGELRQAWGKSDDAVHVHAFWDVQTLGNLVVQAALEEPVLDVDRVTVSYSELAALIRDLRACGATNLAAGRRRGLTGRKRWQRFVEAFWRDQGEGREGRLNLTVELIFGHAFGSRRQARSGGEVAVPVDSIGRR